MRTKEFTIKDVEDALKSIPSTPREYIMWTSEEGLKDFNVAIKRTSVFDCAERALKNKFIVESEFKRIKGMIYSDDQDNLSIAQSILEEKCKNKTIAYKVKFT